jgi:hypothetical protein
VHFLSRETITEFTFMAANGCRREMGGADAAESMDARLVEDSTEECEAWDTRESRGTGRASRDPICGSCNKVADCCLLTFRYALFSDLAASPVLCRGNTGCIL